MQFSKLKISLVVASALFLAACASSNNEDIKKLPFVQANEQELFSGAQTFIIAKDYTDADRYLTQLQLQYPFSQFSEEARVMNVYANFKSGDVAKTIAAIQRLQNDIPNSKYTDFALFVKALTTIELNKTFLQSIFKLDAYKRNVTDLKDALQDLYVIVQKYPNSQYINQAKTLINYLEPQLALFEITVANFYKKYNNPLAVISRAEVIINNFPNSYYAKLAYQLEEDAYNQLGLTEQANQANQQYQALGNLAKPVVTYPTITIDALPFALTADNSKTQKTTARPRR